MVICRIHSEWIDTADFDHPGGALAQKMADGRDATTLFEMHHPFSDRKYLRNVLDKYSISDEEATKRGYHLTEHRDEDGPLFDWKWEQTEFRKDLNQVVGDYFREMAKIRGITVREAIKPELSWWIWIWANAIFATYITVFHYFPGEFWSCFVLVPPVWIVTASLMHEGSHFALSTQPWLNSFGTHCAPWLAPQWCWIVQHVIGHHAATNCQGRDPDLYHAPKNWRYNSDTVWRPAHAWQNIYFPFIWMLATISTSVKNESKDPLQYNGVVSMLPRPDTERFYKFCTIFRNLALHGALFLLPHFTMHSHVKAIFMPLILWCGLSLFFMGFSQLSHLDSESVDQHCREDYFKHEVLTASDYACDSYFWTYASIGLNMQVVHHLFCTISYSHYLHIHPLIKGVCEKHRVNYNTVPTWFDALQNYRDQLFVLSEDPKT